MKVSDINKAAAGLDGLEEQQKRAILTLIDLKVEDDMQSILSKISGLSHKIDEIDRKLDRQHNFTYNVLIAAVVAILICIEIIAIICMLKR